MEEITFCRKIYPPNRQTQLSAYHIQAVNTQNITRWRLASGPPMLAKPELGGRFLALILDQRASVRKKFNWSGGGGFSILKWYRKSRIFFSRWGRRSAQLVSVICLECGGCPEGGFFFWCPLIGSVMLRSKIILWWFRERCDMAWAGFDSNLVNTVSVSLLRAQSAGMSR